MDDTNRNYFTEENQCKYSTIESRINSHTVSEKKVNFSVNNTTMFEEDTKGKIMLQTVFEKRSYEDKVNILKNRIKKLQEQEAEINKKTGKMKDKYLTEQKIKNEKNERKEQVSNYRTIIEQQKAEKKQEIESLRLKRKEEIEKSNRDRLQRNKKTYQVAKHEKIFWKSIETDIKSHNSNLKNYKCLKVKQDLVEGKTERFKSQVQKEEETKENYDKKLQKELEEKENLKKMLKELEEKELEHINKIKHTVLMKQQELEDFKTNSHIKKDSAAKNNLSSSLVMSSGKKNLRLESTEKQAKSASVVKDKRIVSSALKKPVLTFGKVKKTLRK